MTNKKIEKNQTVLLVDLINQDYESKSTTAKNNSTLLQTDVIK